MKLIIILAIILFGIGYSIFRKRVNPKSTGGAIEPAVDNDKPKDSDEANGN